MIIAFIVTKVFLYYRSVRLKKQQLAVVTIA